MKSVKKRRLLCKSQTPRVAFTLCSVVHERFTSSVKPGSRTDEVLQLLGKDRIRCPDMWEPAEVMVLDFRRISKRVQNLEALTG